MYIYWIIQMESGNLPFFILTISHTFVFNLLVTLCIKAGNDRIGKIFVAWHVILQIYSLHQHFETHVLCHCQWHFVLAEKKTNSHPIPVTFLLHLLPLLTSQSLSQ